MAASAAVLVSVAPQAARPVAAYGPGSNNTWTQYYNTYDSNCAYTGSIPCGNPSCDPNSCQQWPYGTRDQGGYFHGTWYYNLAGSSTFHAAVAQAITDASNLPYYSPSFQEETGVSCSDVQLCITGNHPGTNNQPCAVTDDYGNPVYAATITFNLDYQWFTGAPGSQSGCSVTAIAHHEMGHVLGLGHSSDPNALMFWAPRAVNFGADEDNGMKAIYLNNYQPTQAGGGQACPSCQAECEALMGLVPAAAFDLTPCGVAALQEPTVTYPGVAPQQLIQKPVGAAKNEVTTAEGLVHQ